VQSSGGAPSDEDYRNWRNQRDGNPGYGEPGAGNYTDYRGENDYRGGGNWRSAGSTDGAVDVCVNELERGERVVDTVEGVNRDAEGWRVDGRLRDGRSFSCTADAASRVRRLAVDGRALI